MSKKGGGGGEVGVHSLGSQDWLIVFRAQCKISMWGSKVIKNFKTKMGEQETKHRGFLRAGPPPLPGLDALEGSPRISLHWDLGSPIGGGLASSRSPGRGVSPLPHGGWRL